MRRATRTAALCFGILAGLAGLEHGYFEILQGNVRPASIMFPSWGPQQCDPAIIWHGCEPAMSLLPNLLITGILTILLSLVIIVWSAVYVQRKYGGMVLILLSLAQLLLGGGFFPPLIGIVGGIAGMRILKPISGQLSGLARFIARLWPWTLIIVVSWLVLQFPIGALYNDFLKSIIGFALILVVVFLPLSVWCAYAKDVTREIQASR